MRNRLILSLIIAVLIIFSGCVDGSSETDDRSDEICYTDYDIGDPAPTYCLVEEKPPDLLIENLHDKDHNVTVRITNESTITYTANVSIDAADNQSSQHILSDVIQTSGNYTIYASTDSDKNSSYDDIIEERYLETADQQWVIRISKDGELLVDRIRSI